MYEIKPYKLIYYKRSITGLFGVGDGVIESFDNIIDAYNRYMELKENKKKYVIHIYRMDVKICLEQFLIDWKKEMEKIQNENNFKTFKNELCENEREFGRLYLGYKPIFSIYLTNDYHIGLYNVDVISLLHLLDTNVDFKTAFRVLTELIENEKPFKSDIALGKAIEGIINPVGFGVEVLLLY